MKQFRAIKNGIVIEFKADTRWDAMAILMLDLTGMDSYSDYVLQEIEKDGNAYECKV